MQKRCIMLFPEFENMKIIDEIREKYDPLANNVRPHVTIVFPFDSDISTKQLKAYLKQSLIEITSFHLKLQHIIKVDDSTGKYLFLSIKDGTEEIKNIHNKLYEGMLGGYRPEWLKKVNFMPHMTIGNFEDSEKLNTAYDEIKYINDVFNTIVKKISVEVIDENEDSIIEIEVGLEEAE